MNTENTTMTNDCKTCPVSTGTHKPAEAVHQIDEPQAEALRLADDCEESATHWVHEIDTRAKAAKMLRAQHARIAELESQLEAIGAGGVEPLRKPTPAAQAVQAAVPEAIEQMAVDRYKVVPSHESMFHRWAVVAGNGTQQLYIGREVECLNMARKFAGAFLDGAFVAMQNTAPAHPAEGVPAQAVELDVDDLIDRLLDAQQDLNLAANVHMDQSIASASTLLDEVEIALRTLAATQPAAQGIDGREFPPLTPELASILGLPCFQCIPFAKALRAAGHTIKTRAEDEQAAVLHWMLGHYFRHGDDWSGAAAQDMSRMKAAAIAAQAKQGGV